MITATCREFSSCPLSHNGKMPKKLGPIFFNLNPSKICYRGFQA